MPSNFSDVQITDADITVTSGLFDTDDGIKLKVTGDAHTRVHLTPQGQVKTGDGTAAPTDSSTPRSAVFELVGGSLKATIPYVNRDVYYIAPYDLDGHDLYATFLIPDIDLIGSFTAIVGPMTGGSVLGWFVASSDIDYSATIIGPSPSNTQLGGLVFHCVNDGTGWVLAPSSGQTFATAATYDPTTTGLAATDVQSAIDELYALINP